MARNNGPALVFGTFDILHPGHIWFLKRASLYGRLIIALTPNKMCLKYKCHKPCHDFVVRKRRLEYISYVDRVASADTEIGSFKIVEQCRPATIVLGYDQSLLKNYLLRRLKKLNYVCKIISLEPYRKSLYGSSRLWSLVQLPAI